nr:hypothetical protein K-LCC10_0326 [Kaumoebavirus]
MSTAICATPIVITPADKLGDVIAVVNKTKGSLHGFQIRYNISSQSLEYSQYNMGELLRSGEYDCEGDHSTFMTLKSYIEYTGVGSEKEIVTMLNRRGPQFRYQAYNKKDNVMYNYDIIDQAAFPELHEQILNIIMTSVIKFIRRQ